MTGPGAADVSVAIIGAGNMAREHAAAFASLEGVRLAGIHSRTRDRAASLAEEFGIEHVADSVADLHDRTGADLVVNTVFETAMRDVTLQALAHDWALLLEKPPGMDAAETREIHQAAEQASRRVFVGLNRRYLGSTRAAVAALEDDLAPRHVVVQDQQSLEEARAHNHPESVVQRWMYANSVHLVDYLRLFGRGPIESVERLSAWDPEQPGVVMARVRFASGDVGIYEGLWDAPGPWAVSVTSRNQRWEMRPLESATVQLRGERRRTDASTDPRDADYKPGFAAQAAEVVKAVRGEPSAATTLAEGLESMELIETIFAQA
jgi:predicted dehydrogenase